MLPISSTASAVHQSSFSAHWNPHLSNYPFARRETDLFDTFQSNERGVIDLPDPYRWLHQTAAPGEAPTHTKEVEEFLASQETLTMDYLKKYSHREEFQKVLTKNWDYPRFGSPRLAADGNYYFRFNTGLQSQSILYRIKRGEEEEVLKNNLDPKQPCGELFLDPNLFSHDGTSSLSFFSFSKSGKYLAYKVSHSGSDVQAIHVRRTDSPHLQSVEDGGERGGDPGRMDIIKNVKFSCLSWLKDDSGFFYSRYPEKIQSKDESKKVEADLDHKLYFHKLGDSQNNDKLIMEDKQNPGYRWDADATEDGKYIILTIQKDSGRSNLIWVADLHSQTLSEKMEWKKIVNEFGSEYVFRANDDSRLYFTTNKDAPQGQVVTFDVNNPEAKFQVLVHEDPNAVLDDFHVTNNNIAVINYARNAKNEIYLHDLNSGKRIKQVGKDLIGTIDTITGNRKDNEFFFCLSDFLSPDTVYRYRFEGHEDQRLTEYRRTVLSGLNPKDFESKQVFYDSTGGTRVPMFLVHRKDFKQDGTAPALQYAYGGFGMNMTPFFSPAFMSFVAQYKGILAVPNIRGGGEYGEAWHRAGSLENKQNSFDDFKYATKYLVANKYAAPDKVAITGGSNGGILVAACVNQAPELFGAAVAQMGVFDMLKYHRYTIGHSWISEFGHPEDPKVFDYLMKYSPLHNINEKVKYPAMMIMTADHDDRVVPSHSFKYAAALQHALPNNPQPLLLNVERNTGHGCGKSTEMRIRSEVDRLTFIALSLRLKWQPYGSSA